METRNGLVVDAETTLATGTAEREAALTMARRTMTKAGSTLGGDKAYDAAAFVKELRELKITPHVAQKKNSAIDGENHLENRPESGSEASCGFAGDKLPLFTDNSRRSSFLFSTACYYAAFNAHREPNGGVRRSFD